MAKHIYNILPEYNDLHHRVWLNQQRDGLILLHYVTNAFLTVLHLHKISEQVLQFATAFYFILRQMTIQGFNLMNLIEGNLIEPTVYAFNKLYHSINSEMRRNYNICN